MPNNSWSLAEAEAKLEEIVERACTDGPQRIECEGEGAVLVVSAADWEAAGGALSSSTRY
jgi:prevent-host-death family protein